MFDSVVKKLERADYFLGNVKALAQVAGGLAHVKMEDQQKLRANLDGFFFELVSAKDFFLQELNNKYASLPRDEATQLHKLKGALGSSGHTDALEVVKSIEKKLSDKNSDLWRINNYRNSATHRELLHFGHVANSAVKGIKTYLFKDPEDPIMGNADLEVIPYCEHCADYMSTILNKAYSQLHI